MGYTSMKDQEIVRTGEVCQEILTREGITKRGIYFVVAFLHDQGRPLGDLLGVLESRLPQAEES